jgi:hypothetical protein
VIAAEKSLSDSALAMKPASCHRAYPQKLWITRKIAASVDANEPTAEMPLNQAAKN